MRSISTKYQSADCQALLLGASGRLGRLISRHWPTPEGLTTQSRRAGEADCVLDPLTMPDVLKKVASRMDSVICLSGVTPAHATQTGDAMSLNTDLALAAIEAAPAGARVFVTSSAAVYGAADGPHLETHDVSPVSEYGAAKLAMEKAALAAGGGRVCVLRIGNVAGADAILGNGRAGMTLDQLEGGGTPQRSYIGPETLARVIHRLCETADVPEIINIAAPGLVEMGDLLDKAGRAWAPRVPTGPVIEKVALDTELLEQFYPFAAEECTAAGMVAQWREGLIGT